MPKVTIDGREIEVPRDTTVLEAACRVHVHIPTLCYHPAVEPYGSCRVCLIEVTDKRGRKRISTACTYPCLDGIQVQTDTERVRRGRRMALELLLARCPNSQVIREMAHVYGVDETRFVQRENADDCILCGLCVRVCEELVGAAAIGFCDRGTEKKVGTPFHLSAERCIGCGACATVCPTGVIQVVDEGDTRTLEVWKTSVKLRRCPDCGEYFAPEVQWDQVKRKSPELVVAADSCPSCRRKESARRLVGYRLNV